LKDLDIQLLQESRPE